MIAFFDASALIYLIEGREPFGSRVRATLTALSQAHPAAGTALSRLSWLECRVGPMKAQDAAVLATYDAFFASCLQLGPEHRLITGDPAFRRVEGVQVLLLK